MIPWADWPVGASIFVPAVRTVALRALMAKEADKRGYRLISCERIERGLLGVRFWRKL